MNFNFTYYVKYNVAHDISLNCIWNIKLFFHIPWTNLKYNLLCAHQRLLGLVHATFNHIYKVFFFLHVLMEYFSLMWGIHMYINNSII